MTTLVSPGVDVTVIDQSQYASAGQGTVPLIILATKADKLSVDGSSVASGTQTSGVMTLLTSQLDLVTQFGTPSFETKNGTVIQGSEISEYGLHSAFSYLGIANRAYVIRADIDLNQLAFNQSEPAGAPVNGTYWFNTAATSFGIFRANGNATPGLAWDAVTPLIPTTSDVDGLYVPVSGYGNNGDIAVVTLTVNNAVYEKVSGNWYLIGSTAWASAKGGSYTLTYATHANVPVGTLSGNIWIKTTDPNYGANYVVELYSSAVSQFAIVSAPLYANDILASAAYGTSLAIGRLYVKYDINADNTATHKIMRYDGSQWVQLSYTASATAPTTAPADGTLWISDEFKVDVMVNNPSTGNIWNGYLNAYPNTDPNGVQIGSAQPTTQSDGTPLVDHDLWLKSDDLVNYPAIYRWNASTSKWVLLDQTDGTTPFGIIFADARPNDDGSATGSTDIVDMLVSNFVDPDAPNPEAYPAGILLFNTRYSTYNVKSYDSTLFTGQGAYSVGAYTNSGSGLSAARWVNASGNDLDGSPFMGRFAQHQMVVKAIRSVIESNDDIRSEFNFFNIMTAPGYPEVISDLQALNVDRKETAFIIADTPMHLKSNATVLNNWATNAANVGITNEFGRTTRYTYSAEYYPQGLGVDTSGNSVTIPASSIALATYGYNDSVAYPWMSPAGTQRGVVQNATSVGYVDPVSSEFVPVVLNQGQRDVLYTNNINPIALLPNRGLVVYGDKTLHPETSALDRINVARLVCYLRADLDALAQPFLFQNNTESTRNAVESIFNRHLGDLLSLGALVDFAVVCDSTNNTPERIDRNELWIDVAIIPPKSINFIYIPIRILNTGAL